MRKNLLKSYFIFTTLIMIASSLSSCSGGDGDGGNGGGDWFVDRLITSFPITYETDGYYKDYVIEHLDELFSSDGCKYCRGYKDCRNYFYTSNDKYYCHGSGKCKWCGGDGWQDGMFGTGPNSITCSACNTPGSGNVGGDGYCCYCGGTGICSHYNGTGIEP